MIATQEQYKKGLQEIKQILDSKEVNESIFGNIKSGISTLNNLFQKGVGGTVLSFAGTAAMSMIGKGVIDTLNSMLKKLNPSKEFFIPIKKLSNIFQDSGEEFKEKSQIDIYQKYQNEYIDYLNKIKSQSSLFAHLNNLEINLEGLKISRKKQEGESGNLKQKISQKREEFKIPFLNKENADKLIKKLASNKFKFDELQSELDVYRGQKSTSGDYATEKQFYKERTTNTFDFNKFNDIKVDDLYFTNLKDLYEELTSLLTKLRTNADPTSPIYVSSFESRFIQNFINILKDMEKRRDAELKSSEIFLNSTINRKVYKGKHSCFVYKDRLITKDVRGKLLTFAPRNFEITEFVAGLKGKHPEFMGTKIYLIDFVFEYVREIPKDDNMDTVVIHAEIKDYDILTFLKNLMTNTFLNYDWLTNLSRFSSFFGGSLQKKQNEYQQMKNQYSGGNDEDLDKMKRGGNKTNQEKRGEYMQNKYANPYKRHRS